MELIKSTLAVALLMLVLSGVQAKVIPTDPAELIASGDQERATELIVQFLRRYHYRGRQLDDENSASIMDEYLEALDPNRSYLLSSDIEEFERYRFRLDDALKDQDLDPAFEIFKRLRERL